MPLLPTPPRSEQPELIDSLEPSEADFDASFGDIRRVNRFLGGTRAVLATLPELLPDADPSRPVRILDIATGSADIPREIVHRFGARYPRLEIVATDNHPKVLALARRLTPTERYPQIRVQCADAFALPFENDAFDIALCSLAVHHFAPDAVVRLLKEMDRIARRGLIVNDIIRDETARGLIWLTTRLVGANRLTRHDAPLSVLRAYTPTEMSDLGRRAGINGFEVRTLPFWRMVFVLRKEPTA